MITLTTRFRASRLLWIAIGIPIFLWLWSLSGPGKSEPRSWGSLLLDLCRGDESSELGIVVCLYAMLGAVFAAVAAWILQGAIIILFAVIGSLFGVTSFRSHDRSV